MLSNLHVKSEAGAFDAVMEEFFTMLTELKNAKKAVGLKQSRKAIKDGCAKRVYLALNADERLCAPIAELCKEQGVEVFKVETMEQLGQACGINVGAAVAVLLK